MKLLPKLTLLFLLIFSLTAYRYGEPILFSGLKPVYTRGEPIKFNITNNTDKDIIVYYSLVSFIKEENEWIEQIPDLSNYNCDRRQKLGVAISELKAKDTIIFQWFPKKANKKSCFNWERNEGKYKITINFRNKKESKYTVLNSSAFTIN